VTRLDTLDSTDLTLFRTSPLVRWDQGEEENQPIKDFAMLAPQENFEITCDFLKFHSDFKFTNKFGFSWDLPPVKLDPYPEAVIHYMTHNKGGSQILQTQGAVALITELLVS
jgi:hypothetical protein